MNKNDVSTYQCYDFRDGGQISEEEIKRWMEEVRKELVIDGKNLSSISSGNSIVVGVKNELGDIFIDVVTSGYRRYLYCPRYDLKK